VDNNPTAVANNKVWEDPVATKIAQFSLVTLVLRLTNAQLKIYLDLRVSNH